MKRFLASIAVLAMLPLAAPALAQVDPAYGEDQQIGTRFARQPETASEAEARWMQKRIAICVFNRNREEAEELLANSNFYQIDFDRLDYAADELWEEFEVNHCIGRLMRGVDNQTLSMYVQIPFSTLRNLLAEEAYLRDNDDAPAITDATEVDIAGRFGGQRVHPQISTMAGLADCVVYNAPGEAHELLQTRPGSNDEQDMVDTLGPIVAACAGATDTMAISASLVRQMTADGLWSRSHFEGAGR